MSKIVTAVNTMISNSDKISEIRPKDNEYFFLYKGKYKWSISYDKQNDLYNLYYYPGDITFEELSQMEDWTHYSNYIAYNTKEIGTREARDTFSELYRAVREGL